MGNRSGIAGYFILNSTICRWRKFLVEPGCSLGSGYFVGVVHHRVWKIWREDQNTIGFKVLHNFSLAKGDDEDTLKKYFQLEVPLQELYKTWSENDLYFKQVLAANEENLTGVRILAQDPFETLLAFICSSNNNIKRITRMVEKLCELYGDKATIVSDLSRSSLNFYDIADLQKMVADDKMEEKLRENGFGYRATYLCQAVRKLEQLGGIIWLRSLSEMDYLTARKMLEGLPGVGPKVTGFFLLVFRLAVKHHLHR
ncbi:unnamed protein product [Enterobius vermicularis]|uniref:DNA-(apurinic or apyrimidinic site) lyase n=1 Tax=Enterobius vermicularis TaxID=51028 RepID=A0A0N4UW16_ENTVE|nr:unnamed protein product [Enterobius vermicularis]